MLDKNKSFETSGEMILQDGTEISKDKGLAWFNNDLKESVESLVKDIRQSFANSEEIAKHIEKHFKVLETCSEQDGRARRL